jgi:hypothetical protein
MFGPLAVTQVFLPFLRRSDEVAEAKGGRT